MMGIVIVNLEDRPPTVIPLEVIVHSSIHVKACARRCHGYGLSYEVANEVPKASTFVQPDDEEATVLTGEVMVELCEEVERSDEDKDILFATERVSPQ